jgi:hypothetical protein
MSVAADDLLCSLDNIFHFNCGMIALLHDVNRLAGILTAAD